MEILISVSVGSNLQFVAILKQITSRKSGNISCRYRRIFSGSGRGCFDQKLLRAARNEGLERLVLTGGVAANGCLRDRLFSEAEKRVFRLLFPSRFIVQTMQR